MKMEGRLVLGASQGGAAAARHWAGRGRAGGSCTCVLPLAATQGATVSPPPSPPPQGTGKWTIQQAAELSVAAPTMEAALDSRFLSGVGRPLVPRRPCHSLPCTAARAAASCMCCWQVLRQRTFPSNPCPPDPPNRPKPTPAGLKEERVAAEAAYAQVGVPAPTAPAALGDAEKQQLIADVRAALYASKASRGMLVRGWEACALLAALPPSCAPFQRTAAGSASRGTDRPAVSGLGPLVPPPPAGVQLRTGLQHHPRQEPGAGVGHRPGRPGPHLEGRLHHPRGWVARRAAGGG